MFESSSYFACLQLFFLEIQVLNHVFRSYIQFHIEAYHLQDLLLWFGKYQALHDIIDFLIWGRSYSFQHKKGAYAYGKNTDGVTLFLKAHHIDQITLLCTYVKHLSDVEFKNEDSVNPFYMENWKCKTCSHFAELSQEFNIKLPECFNHITLNILKLPAPRSR